MSDNSPTEDPGEVSAVDRLRPGGVPTEDDAAPDADLANQVEDGAPKNYGSVDPDPNLPPDPTS